MAQGILRVKGTEEVAQSVIAASSEVFALWSPVFINTSGFLAVISSSGEKIYGFCAQAFTASATNENGAVQTYDATAIGYAPPVILPENVEFWADSDQAATQTDIGAYADVASEASGVVTINLAAGATGQFLVTGIDPFNEGDTDRVTLRVAEPQIYAFAQS